MVYHRALFLAILYGRCFLYTKEEVLKGQIKQEQLRSCAFVHLFPPVTVSQLRTPSRNTCLNLGTRIHDFLIFAAFSKGSVWERFLRKDNKQDIFFVSKLYLESHLFQVASTGRESPFFLVAASKKGRKKRRTDQEPWPLTYVLILLIADSTSTSEALLSPIIICRVLLI